MRRHLLLALMVAVPLCLGSECSSSSGKSAASSSNSSSALQFEGSETDFATPMPEPSAALIFGVGLLIAGAAARRRS